MIRLRPGQAGAYRRTHQAVWPEVIEANRRAGIRNHSTFVHDDMVFGYLECDDYAKTEELRAQSDAFQRWIELHTDIFEPDPATGGFKMDVLEEAFHQD